MFIAAGSIAQVQTAQWWFCGGIPQLAFPSPVVVHGDQEQLYLLPEDYFGVNNVASRCPEEVAAFTELLASWSAARAEQEPSLAAATAGGSADRCGDVEKVVSYELWVVSKMQSQIMRKSCNDETEQLHINTYSQLKTHNSQPTPMTTIADLQRWLAEFAPPRLAAEWDNVGLLVGDASREVTRVMTCLTVTAESVAEAIREGAQLIVTHHPFPFSAVKRITSETHAGRLLLSLIEGRIAVLSPHTAFDSARGGINRRLAERIGLEYIQPLIEDSHDAALGTGRQGTFAGTLGELAARACAKLGIAQVQLVGNPARLLERVAVGCGSAGELLAAAHAAECDCFVTGEARFHTALEAQALGMTMILLGHYASERFAVEELAQRFIDEYPTLHCWPSRDEADPIGNFSPAN